MSVRMASTLTVVKCSDNLFHHCSPSLAFIVPTHAVHMSRDQILLEGDDDDDDEDEDERFVLPKLYGVLNERMSANSLFVLFYELTVKRKTRTRKMRQPSSCVSWRRSSGRGQRRKPGRKENSRRLMLHRGKLRLQHLIRC